MRRQQTAISSAVSSACSSCWPEPDTTGDAVPTATNVIPYSRDLTGAGWVAVSTPVITYDQPGTENDPNTGSRVDDQSASESRYALEQVFDSWPGQLTVTFVAWVRKSTNTHRGGFWCHGIGSTLSGRGYTSFRTDSATLDGYADTAGTIREMNDLDNGFYEILVQMNVEDLTQVRVDAYGAATTGASGNIDVAATGYTDFPYIGAFVGQTIEDMRGKNPIHTNGSAVTAPLVDMTTEYLFPLMTDLWDTTGTYELSYSTNWPIHLLNDSGVMVTIPEDTPHFTADGLFTTSAGGNYLTANSYRDFTDAAWTPSGIVVDSDSITSIDGSTRTTNTLRLTAASGTITHDVFTNGNTSWTTGIFIQQGNGRPDVELSCDGGTTWVSIAVGVALVYEFAEFAGAGANPEFAIRLTGDVGDTVIVDWGNLLVSTNQTHGAWQIPGESTLQVNIGLDNQLLSDLNNGAGMFTYKVDDFVKDSDMRLFGCNGVVGITSYCSIPSDTSGRINGVWGGAYEGPLTPANTIQKGATHKIGIGRDDAAGHTFVSIDGTSWTSASTDITGTFVKWWPFGSTSGNGAMSGFVKDLRMFVTPRTVAEVDIETAA